MGWIGVKPPKHRCDLPDLKEVGRIGANKGSRWQCDDCDQIWTLSQCVRGSDGSFVFQICWERGK